MVDLLPDPDQQQLIDSIVGFLEREAPIARLRREGHSDRAAWTALAELGWIGIALPEAEGGMGLSLAEEALVFREYGRRLFSPLALATALAVRVAGGSEAAQLLSGAALAALAVPVGPGWERPQPDREVFLIDAAPGDLVVAWGDTGAALYDGAGLTAAEVASVDGTVLLQRSRLVAPVATADGGALHRTARVLIAAMQVGIAEATRDMAAEHARTREQFGQKIGAFQAVKHRCADMAVRAEAAWSQTVFGALAAGREDAEFQAAAARVVASDAAQRNAAACIQLHGGMGFTAECDAQAFLKRAHLLARIDAGIHRLAPVLLAGAAG